ncbi:MAG: YncE family protein [bacterium]|jgi:DNA-binding beta-propeller fold protein YncE
MLRKLLVIALLSALACGGGQQRPATQSTSIGTTRVSSGDIAQVVFYARLMHEITPGIRWELRKVSLETAGGSQVDLATETRIIDTDHLAGAQRLLRAAEVPPGDYTGITFFTEAAYVKPDNTPMVIETSIITVDHAFSLAAGSARTLIFVLSHPPAGGRAEPVFSPVIEIEDENQSPTSKLLYVSNENSANISVVDKSMKRVVYNAYLGARPTAIGADNRRGRLYIADERTGTVFEMDMNSNHLSNVAELDFVDEPVFVLPIPEKDLIVVVNYGTDTVHLLDSFSLQPVSTVEVGRRPTKAIYSNVWERAFIINSLHGTLSVLNLQSTPSAPDTTLQAELRPSGLAINEADDWLYVSNEGSTDITVIRMETLAIERSLTVGTGVTDIAFDPFGRRLYVAFGFSQEVKCIDPYNGVEIFTVNVGSSPAQLMFDPDQKKLYALLPAVNAIALIDPNLRSLETIIETGESPSGMALRL